MGQLADALEAADIEILKYNPEKQRPISTANHGTISVEKFCKTLITELGSKGILYPEVFEASHSVSAMAKLLASYAKETGIHVGDRVIEVPEEFEGLTLNMDITSPRDLKFFMTDDKEIVSVVSGAAYVRVLQMKEPEAVAAARKVVPEYLPRDPRGITKRKFEGKALDVFNTYVPPKWKGNPYWKDAPDKLPPLFEKLVHHLFPLAIEREYFYSWLYYSMFKRSFVYLILCGNPGTGKNRLKLVLRALHGHVNTIDGKRSTLIERFNSQLADSTLAWFDELHYDMEMENMMKELQNDSISIERKGIDATRSTRIHASLIISNNKPRDNYIAFDARKFCPLYLTPDRLEKSMTPKEIDILSRKVEDDMKETFDIDFLTQIAKWIKKHGRSDKWPHLEYKGPMFYKLAHTSMSRWQKKAATLILETNPSSSGRLVYDEKKGFLWSSLHESVFRKNGDRSLTFPDFSTVKHFFDVFVDGKGDKAFKTLEIRDNIMGDFWVRKLIDNVKIITESTSVAPEKGAKGGKKEIQKEDYLDL